jgi:hypothetical protein
VQEIGDEVAFNALREILGDGWTDDLTALAARWTLPRTPVAASLRQPCPPHGLTSRVS